MTTRIIIDTDPGVDDALTFLLALASPEIQLEALTTVQGNVTSRKPPATRSPCWKWHMRLTSLLRVDARIRS
jgi:inosine-uridine nucleoside N-ribohydrolase